MRSRKVIIPVALAAVTLLVVLPLLATAQSGSGGSGSSGSGSSGPGAGDRVRLRAILSGTDADPLAGGHGDFEQRPDRLRLSVEVEDVAFDTDVAYAVVGNEVDGFVFVGFIAIDPNGSGDLNLDSRDGDNVPVLQAGDGVFVFDFNTDTLLLFGTLAPR